MASSVFSLADNPARGAVSSSEIVPSAPRMSPACASSAAAERVMVAMVNTPFTSRKPDGNRGTRSYLPGAGQGELWSGNLRWSGVCPEQSGTAARRAYFGPDYQSPSRASLPVATHGGARPHQAARASDPAASYRVTPEETHARAGEIPGRTSLVRALALHGVLRTGPGLCIGPSRQPLGLTP